MIRVRRGEVFLVSHVVLDHIRVVDQARLVRRLGVLSRPVVAAALATLREMFAD